MCDQKSRRRETELGQQQMKPKSFGFVLATAGWLLLAGCVQGTVHERNASFSSYSDNRLGLESTKDFLTSRTALLFGGVRLTITPSTTNSHVFNFQAASSSIVIGCAAAVDRRGYFLTVAHALGKEPPWLVFGSTGHMQAQRARVVWRGGRSS